MDQIPEEGSQGEFGALARGGLGRAGGCTGLWGRALDTQAPEGTGAVLTAGRAGAGPEQLFVAAVDPELSTVPSPAAAGAGLALGASLQVVLPCQDWRGFLLGMAAGICEIRNLLPTFFPLPTVL